MNDARPHADSIIEWGWAGSALEAESGDLHVVVPFAHGVLVALLDGLGHGPEAAAASTAAAPILQAHASDPLLTLVQRCHEGLRQTRGAVMSLASFSSRHSSMSWVGVGNVDGVLLRGSASAQQRGEAIALRGGVVGYRLPPLRPQTVPLSCGDTLIMATDGIRNGFSTGLSIDPCPQEMAESILARFANGTDDARVVVARYVGRSP
jgi:negative regulator of sigma-B (phosphoserine phosphatase)